MSTYINTPQFDDSDMVALTQILENSGHCQARHLLDKLYRGSVIQTSASYYEPDDLKDHPLPF